MDAPIFADATQNFTNVEKIRSGFQSQAFKAYDESRKRQVALKRITRGHALEHAQAITRIPAHQYLVTIHHVVDLQLNGDEKAEPCIVMEWLPGVTLAEYREGESSSEAEGRSILRKVLPAIQHMHNHGFVHGELHAENIKIDGDSC